jgi:hypothetical protein
LQKAITEIFNKKKETKDVKTRVNRINVASI